MLSPFPSWSYQNTPIRVHALLTTVNSMVISYMTLTYMKHRLKQNFTFYVRHSFGTVKSTFFSRYSRRDVFLYSFLKNMSTFSAQEDIGAPLNKYKILDTCAMCLAAMIACGAIFQLGTFFWKRGKMNISNTSIESNQEQPKKSKKLDSSTLTQYTIGMGIIKTHKQNCHGPVLKNAMCKVCQRAITI